MTIKNNPANRCVTALILLTGLLIHSVTNGQTHVFAQLNGSPVNTNGWNFIGAARLGNVTGTGNSEVIVCPLSTFQSGAVFYKEPLNLSLCNKWIAEFDFRIFDGSLADGLAFCFLDLPPAGLVAGGGMGIPATANGLKICFDPNPNCFPLNFNIYPKVEIRWGAGYDECWLQPTVDNSTGALSFVRSNNYVHAKIIYNNGNISVYLNNTLYVTAFQQFNFTGYLGFTAATGAKNDNHSIKNVVIYTSMPPSEAGLDQTVCSGQPLQIGTGFTPGLLYAWIPGVGLDNAAIANPTATLTNATNSKTNYKYFVKTAYDTAAGCTSQDSVIVTVLPAVVLSNLAVNISGCAGVNYKLPSGKYVPAPGVYNDTIRNILGCDSLIAKYNLTAIATIHKNIDTTISAGNNYHLPSGAVVFNGGIYNDTIRTSAGCDSLITITRLTFASNCLAKINQQDTSVCPGNPLGLSLLLTTNSATCNTYALSPQLQEGLIGWYPFCGSTNDIGPQQNNGFATGALTYGGDRYSNPGAAIYFTGNGESIRTNKIERTTTNSFSYVTWVNTANSVVLPAETIDPASGFYTDLASTCVIHAVHGYNWNTDHKHTGAGLFVATNGVFVLEHTDVIVPTPLVWKGNLTGWHSVALVYDNHVPKLYIDGKFVKSGLVTPYTVHPSFGCDSVFLNGRFLYLTSGFGKGFNASANTVPSNNFRGAIDDIKIYNRVLSDAEIDDLYNKDIYKILWSTGDNNPQVNIKPLQSTKYWVSATNGSIVCSDTVHVNILPTPVVNLGPDTTACIGTTLLLNAPAVNGDQYKWQDNSTNNSFTVSKEGLYFVSVSNQQGCTAADTIQVMYKSIPVFTLGTDTVLCANYPFTLTAGTGKGDYLWNTGASSNFIKIITPGLYWLQVSNSGCSKRDSIEVGFKPAPKIDLGKDTLLCEGQQVILNATNNNAIYLWQDGSTAPIYTVKKAGTYTVKVSENGCDTSGQMSVQYNSKPMVKFSKDTTMCVGQQLILNAINSKASYLWQDGSVLPQFTVTNSGTYVIQVSNTCGLTVDSIKVNYENCACQFYVPSAFSPNKDRKNDVFIPIHRCLYSNYELKIFNRWGQVVFLTQKDNTGWDGTLNGYEQAQGVYVWVLSYIDSLTNKRTVKKGTIILIR